MIAADPKGPFRSPPPGRLYGVYPAVVTDVKDAKDLGRVQVELPWVAEDDVQARAWARLATLMAGAERGTWFIPEVGDEVLVSFVAGDPRHPVVVGALWNGADAPPEQMDGAGNNDIRSITSRSGHRLCFDDSAGGEKVLITTQGGHHLELDDSAGGTIRVQHSGGAEIIITAAGEIQVTAVAKVVIDAPAGLDVTAAMVQVNAPMSTFSGVVQCDTLITNMVVSSAYTPGAGNVW